MTTFEGMDADAFWRAAANACLDGARCEEAVGKIADALRGHATGEGLLALCFHLNSMLSQLPLEARHITLAAVMQMITLETE